MPRKRQSGEGALYFDKKRDLWIAVYQNGYKPDGTRNQIRRTSRTQAGARAKLNEVKDEINSHGSPLGNQTVAEWGAFWLEEMKRKKPATYRAYASLMKTWVLPVIGRKNLKLVRPSDLQRIYKNIRDAGRSPSTALKAHNVMSGMFEAARLEKLVPINVAQNVKAPTALKADRDTFTPDETLRILQAALTVRDGSKWVVSLYGGIRQGERLGATLEAVDVVRGLFTVWWNLVEGNYEHGCGGTCGKKAGHCPQKRLIRPDGIESRVLKGRLMLVPPKSGESRAFPLPLGMVDLLNAHVSAMQDRPNPHGLLWPAQDGNPMSARDDQAEWRTLLALAEVDRPAATTHWARHTAISDFAASGVPDRVVGEIVGHKSPGVTGRYQHVSSQDSQEAMRKLGERRQVER